VSVESAIPVAAEIVADVRRRGDAALLEWTERLDGVRPDPLRVPAETLAAARLRDEELAALRRMAAAVEAFNRPQRPPDVEVEAVPGVRAARRWVPLASVGVYVPGGKAPLPSSLVMAVVPARVAGVERIVVVTPRPAEATLAAAHALGVDEVYAVGGAQAIAALAYGTESIPRVDKIVGPGNRFVTAAKILCATAVAIDLPAGPSEVVVIADGTAPREAVIASCRAQMEHGPDSTGVLVTTDAALADAASELVTECRLVDSLEAALTAAEQLAPEHLELWCEGAAERARAVRNAGTVCVRTTAVVGDYAAGASHVLPTGGLARGASGLGLEAFLKAVQVIEADDLAAARAIGVPLARLEGLEAHARALELA
jgi:histidinol dehydrogenase